MFSPKDMKRFIADMRQDIAVAVRLGICAMLILPALIITTQM